jgi:hypothetical protein
MQRFSDRLTSTSNTTTKLKNVLAVIDNSDDASTILNGDSTSPTDHEYVGLVELLGLHQTVKILANEYNLISGADSKMAADLEFGGG